MTTPRKPLPITISPCPFCGSKLPVVNGSDISHWHRVICVRNSCDVMGPLRHTARGAILAWNRAVRGAK